jgi:hypothetical protein
MSVLAGSSSLGSSRSAQPHVLERALSVLDRSVLLQLVAVVVVVVVHQVALCCKQAP